MKNPILIVLLVIAITYSASGQIDSAAVKLYDSWYYLNTGLKNKLKVFTYDFGDSTITTLARNGYFHGSLPAISDLCLIPVQDINKIVFRRKGQQIAMLFTGLAAGALIGGIVGYSNGDDPPGSEIGVSAGVKAYTGALIGAGIGVGIGLTLGSVKKTVHVDGNVERFKLVRPKPLKYSIRYYQHKTPLIMN